MEIQYLVDQGLKRRSNQDFAGLFKNQRNQTLAIVADGMGGHLAGDVASKMAVEELGEQFKQTSFERAQEATYWFIQQLQNENQRIYAKGQENPNFFGMGTTVVALIIFEDEFVLAHVGDSRAYLLKNQQLRQITVDHSLVQELVNQGEITPAMAKAHPQKNVVTRSVGMPGTVEVDVMSMKIFGDEQILLSSDGLTNMVDDDVLAEVLMSERTTQEKVNTLVETANKNGGLDNITVMVIDFNKGARHD
ncbi:Stp1/IreP family PP2C-type Ser/Thr phosphatase [Enterococcus timonensis]|uniref:Stp1/IreP family PP2C-type Ser/Thr phosphatase n=1 Tax=Enterococcus timonensis TaxID=1852364 RepID=UPI0008DADA70|nr:Stp1/IreP family PP2C-type Ser/Thr phosphatase [Enterococcus timonensis]